MTLNFRNSIIFSLFLFLVGISINHAGVIYASLGLILGFFYAYTFNNKFSNFFLFKALALFILAHLLISWLWINWAANLIRSYTDILTHVKGFFRFLFSSTEAWANPIINDIYRSIYISLYQHILTAVALFISLKFGNWLYFELKKLNYLKSE